MAKQAPTFYVFHGEDEYTRKAKINEIRADMNDPSGLNIAVLEGSQVSATEIVNLASAIPFLSDKRLVIVEGFLSQLAKRGKGGQAEFDVLVERLPALPDFSRVIFHEDTTLSEKNPVIKLIREDPHGYEKAFNAPQNPVGWITKQAEAVYGVQIEPAAAHALSSVVDKDLRAADNELAKLAAYVDGERPISEADVALLTTYVPEPDIFRMVDAIGQQDGKNAIQICLQLLNKQEPLSLFGMINRQFRLLLLAREYFDQQGSLVGLGAAIGVHDFVAKKVGQQARSFESLEQIETIYKKLAEYDHSIKTGKIPDEMALQMFIAGVTN